ncbi:MAG: hypothetical protein ACKO1N_00350 [Erythrobacter sp.]
MAMIAPRLKDPEMSQQLTLSSFFCVLALAGLCMVSAARDLAGVEAPLAAQHAELSPSVLQG